ncbi:MAG TPA: hypothetical protein VEW71_06035 [Allosphingosinicella sp.]|nr:hypothetical protein [Allosphingosinicella sp.]
MTIRKTHLLFGVSLLAAAASYAAPASAQATRTWVSGVGDDVNPCSRTAPCKTFAGAISKTAAGGEINCLDPGGFGAVTITKSMTISCPYTEGGALAGGNGVLVNDSLSGSPNTAVVFLRGLDIFGVNPPTNGVRFISGAALHIEDCTIRRFNAANSQGVSFQPAGAAQLFISNTTIAENGNGVTGGGILIQPTGAGGTARVYLNNVRVHNNANANLAVNSTGNTGAGIALTILDSSFVGSGVGINFLVPAGTTNVGAMVVNARIVNNVTGILTSGATLTVRVGNSTINDNSGITANAGGVINVGGSQLLSYGDNRLDGNFNAGGLNNGTFTGAAIPKR